MKAVILAGGSGVRFRPLTFSKPKPMLPLLNKPLVEHILDYIIGHGITEVCITTNYRREQIINSLGLEYKGVKLSYPFEEEPLGTAGSVKNIQNLLDETFVVIQGDTISDIDISSLVRDHHYNAGLVTIATTTVDDPWNYGVVETEDGGRIKRFHEKPQANECATNQINTGLYVVEPEALDMIPEKTFYDFAKDLFPKLVERGSIYASKSDGFWADVGRIDGYNKAKEWLMGRINTRIPDSMILDGSIEGQVYFGENVIVKRGARIVGPVVIGDNSVIDSGSTIMPFSSVGNNLTMRANTLVEGAVLFENSIIGAGNRIQNSLLAEDCVLGADSSIQANVLIGSSCMLEKNVSVIEGSRIWPNTFLPQNSTVSGTLRSFIPKDEVYNDPLWSLRTVTPDEAFYFNKLDGSHILFTGFRARSLLEFSETLKNVEDRSLEYHLRGDVNDFRRWSNQVLGDMRLADSMERIKAEFLNAGQNKTFLRSSMAELASKRLDELVVLVSKTKLYK